MKKLTLNQRKALAEFCGNFAVAWLAAGLLPVLLTNKITIDSFKSIIMAIVAAGILLRIMLELTGGRK